MQSAIVRRFRIFLPLFGVTLLLVALAFLYGFLSVRTMAVVYIVLCIAGVWILTIVLTDAKRKGSSGLAGAAQSPALIKARRLVWALRALVALSLGVLGYGMWASSGAPLMPRIFGIVMGGLVAVGFFMALRKQRRKLDS